VQSQRGLASGLQGPEIANKGASVYDIHPAQLVEAKIQRKGNATGKYNCLHMSITCSELMVGA
jgi:hypothetical protein